MGAGSFELENKKYEAPSCIWISDSQVYFLVHLKYCMIHSHTKKALTVYPRFKLNWVSIALTVKPAQGWPTRSSWMTVHSWLHCKRWTLSLENSNLLLWAISLSALCFREWQSVFRGCLLYSVCYTIVQNKGKSVALFARLGNPWRSPNSTPGPGYREEGVAVVSLPGSLCCVLRQTLVKGLGFLPYPSPKV